MEDGCKPTCSNSFDVTGSDSDYKCNVLMRFKRKMFL